MNLGEKRINVSDSSSANRFALQVHRAEAARAKRAGRCQHVGWKFSDGPVKVPDRAEHKGIMNEDSFR